MAPGGNVSIESNPEISGALPADGAPNSAAPLTTASSDGEARDMGTAALPGRGALEISVVRALSKRSDAHGLLRFGIHLVIIIGGGFLVHAAMPHWWLMIPAIIFQGFAIVTMFAPMHECVHKTAFNSRWLNEVVGWIAGLLSFYNFTYYRYYHTWHHRYTQDPDKDPELMTPKPRNVLEYLEEVSGWSFWTRRPWMFFRLVIGRTQGLPFIPDNAKRNIAISAGIQLSLYAAGLVLIAFGQPFFWYYYFLPAILGQPILRAILISEHTGCTQDENGLTNTRTTLTTFPIRLLMWNMPYHAEHHLYPSIPFHQLPQAHVEIRGKLAHLSPSYVASNRTILKGLGKPV